MPSNRSTGRLVEVLCVSLLTLVADTGCRSDARSRARSDTSTVASVVKRPPFVLTVPPPSAPPPVSHAQQKAFMLRSARTAWAFIDRNTMPATGIVPAHETYKFVTVWDIASSVASVFSARQLELISQADYDRRMSLLLTTLQTMPLYDNGAFNKTYASDNARMIDRAEQPSARGYGWSVIDIGRLLIWLRIVEQRDTARANAVRSIAARIDMKRLVQHGYLAGQDVGITGDSTKAYPEGRIGYEQYAAEGFSLWGERADSALDFATNGDPVTVDSETVLKDRRGTDLLTSEPFVVMGLELGWSEPNWRALSLSILAAQEARFNATGIVTMLSEDAIPKPPAYFYYYLLYRDGRSFVVAAPGGAISDTFPRWVSAKAAFGYHALAPSAYTWKALQAVKWGAEDGRGWTAGVIENSHISTGTFNLNTAAVVLEAAAYFQHGCALILPRCPTKTPSD